MPRPLIALFNSLIIGKEFDKRLTKRPLTLLPRKVVRYLFISPVAASIKIYTRII